MDTAHSTAERTGWQWGIAIDPTYVAGELVEVDPSRIVAHTAIYRLTIKEAAEVMAGYRKAMDSIEAAGHQIDEGIWVGAFRSKSVCEAVAELVSITPTNPDACVTVTRVPDAA
jgi:hypothetical protein